MKKWIAYILLMLITPLIIGMGFHILYPEIPMGMGEGMEAHYMNRDVLIEIHGLYKSIDVEEYVLGIMPTVISPEYEQETLKTQAVLIRTNVLKEMEEKNTKDGADLSYEYLSKEDREQLWGKRHFDKWELKFERAVNATSGKVIKKEGNLIMAAYHEVSIGKTASAKEILDEDISYLQSVESSHDVEAKNYMNLIEYTYPEIKEILRDNTEHEINDTTVENINAEIETDNVNNYGINESENGKTENDNSKITVNIDESTDNGFVKKASVDGTIYTGEDMMRLFELPSNNFYVEEVSEGVRFVCLGKGNCLGLSQYGANYMACEGKSMAEIINYFYQGVSIEPVVNN